MSDFIIQPAVDKPKCPACASVNLRPYRREFGTKGQWNWSWEEGTECADCGRSRIPLTPSTS